MSASLSARNNNPGNMIYNSWTASIGATEGERGFAKFPDAVSGMAALARLFAGGKYIERTIEKAFYRYAPPSDSNDTEAYIEHVCRAVSVSRETKIKDLGPFEFLELLKAITIHEGWKR